jgi:hypothetical protein
VPSEGIDDSISTGRGDVNERALHNLVEEKVEIIPNKEASSKMQAIDKSRSMKDLESGEDALDQIELSKVLSMHQFKPLWAALEVAGSFQCNLRISPNLQNLLSHLKKQNFHIIYASSLNETDTEIAICNIRYDLSEAWFMARFVFSSKVFSAVMKCQNLDSVEIYVKKFSLARVLKIDTTA